MVPECAGHENQMAGAHQGSARVVAKSSSSDEIFFMKSGMSQDSILPCATKCSQATQTKRSFRAGCCPGPGLAPPHVNHVLLRLAGPCRNRKGSCQKRSLRALSLCCNRNRDGICEFVL